MPIISSLVMLCDRKKAVKRVANCHRHVRRRRQDFHHKQSRILVDCYEMIVFEDLKPANMSRRPKPKPDENGNFLPNGAAAKGGLNKSIVAVGWSAFIAMVRVKAESAGHVTYWCLLRIPVKFVAAVSAKDRIKTSMSVRICACIAVWCSTET